MAYGLLKPTAFAVGKILLMRLSIQRRSTLYPWWCERLLNLGASLHDADAGVEDGDLGDQLVVCVEGARNCFAAAERFYFRELFYHLASKWLDLANHLMTIPMLSTA
jgi:hypothetical protein